MFLSIANHNNVLIEGMKFGVTGSKKNCIHTKKLKNIFMLKLSTEKYSVKKVGSPST